MRLQHFKPTGKEENQLAIHLSKEAGAGRHQKYPGNEGKKRKKGARL
jgi:hypothetical protein